MNAPDSRDAGLVLKPIPFTPYPGLVAYNRLTLALIARAYGIPCLPPRPFYVGNFS